MNPEAPYSTFHAISVPLAVQPKSKELLVTLDEVKALGLIHEGVSLISISSNRISL